MCYVFIVVLFVVGLVMVVSVVLNVKMVLLLVKIEIVVVVVVLMWMAVNVVCDKYCNLVVMFVFFGVKFIDKVIEIWLGGGWYIEILVFYFCDKG